MSNTIPLPPPMSEADEKRLNAALTIVFDLACGPADPTMMQDELVAAAESIGMRFPAPAVPRHVRKIGGSFQHSGTVVAEFKTTAGEPRIVLEFDAPVAGMLHVYRPDQVEPCESAAPAVPDIVNPITDADLDRIADAVPVDDIGVHITTWHRRFARAVLSAAGAVREPLRDDAFHAWVEEVSADHQNLLERQEFRNAMYNAWINGYNTRVDEQAHGIGGGK